MAKILFTAFLADARNKVAGTVFSKNRYGAYTRTKVTPVNPNTAAQAAVRGRLAARATAWRGLTELQRQSWIDAAPSFPFTDIFGASKILSGQALYNKLNLQLAAAGQAAINTAPTPVAVPSLVSLDCSADAGTPDVLITAGLTPVPAGFTLVVQATPSYGQGIYFVKNRFRQVTTIAAAGAVSNTSIISPYQDVFPDPVATQKISVRAFLVSNTTGQAGIAFSATAVVAP